MTHHANNHHTSSTQRDTEHQKDTLTSRSADVMSGNKIRPSTLRLRASLKSCFTHVTRHDKLLAWRRTRLRIDLLFPTSHKLLPSPPTCIPGLPLASAGVVTPTPETFFTFWEAAMAQVRTCSLFRENCTDLLSVCSRRARNHFATEQSLWQPRLDSEPAVAPSTSLTSVTRKILT